MKPVPALLILFAISIFCFSCKKDSTDSNNNNSNNNNNNNNNNTSADSSYVDKIYLIDSTAAGEDTSIVEVLQYDNLKRVTYIIDTTFFSGSPELFAKKHFEYNGNDSLPFKSTLYIQDGTANTDTVIIYFYFDNTGSLVKDSIIDITWNSSPYYQGRQQIINISYAAGMMYGLTSDSTLFVNGVPSTNPPTFITDTVTLDANGNQVHGIEHRGSSIFEATYSFDNHPHPFRRLNIYNCWTKNIFASHYFDPSLPNTNNVTHVHEVAVNGPNFNYDYDIINTYYSDGRVKTIVQPDSGNPGEYEKYLFVYKSL